MEKKKDPLTFLSENKKTILKALNKSSSDVKSAWLMLHEELPEINGFIKFNDFRNYAESLFYVRKETRKHLFRRIQILKTKQYRMRK